MPTPGAKATREPRDGWYPGEELRHVKEKLNALVLAADRYLEIGDEIRKTPGEYTPSDLLDMAVRRKEILRAALKSARGE